MKMMSWSRYHCLPWYLMHIHIRLRRGGLISAGHTVRRRRRLPADIAGAGHRAPASASKPGAPGPSVPGPSVSNS
jgi:hypothetical protein